MLSYERLTTNHHWLRYYFACFSCCCCNHPCCWVTTCCCWVTTVVVVRWRPLLLLQSQALNDRDAMMPPSEARNNCTLLFVNMHNPPLLRFHIVPRWRRRSFNNLHLHRGHHTVEYTCDWYIMVRMDKEEEDEERRWWILIKLVILPVYSRMLVASLIRPCSSKTVTMMPDAENRLVSYTCLSSSDNIGKDWNINQGRRRRIKINENGSSCACCRCSAVVSISTPAVVSISECPSLHGLYAPRRRPSVSVVVGWRRII